MGQRNSISINNKSPKVDRDKHRPAVFSDDCDEAIFQKNFGETFFRPKMPNIEAIPNVPNRVQIEKRQSPPKNLSFSNFAPVPPPRRNVETRPIVPSHSSSNHLLSVSPHRQNSNVSTKSLPPNHMCERHPLLIAQHRFLAKAENEISLEEGDQIYLLDTSHGDWWYVETKSNQKGFIPKSHVKRVEVHEKWFVGNISRIEAERRIMQPNLPIGTFLIRENSAKNTLVLTVRKTADSFISYEVRRGRNDNGFYMSDSESNVLITFSSLPALVDYFSREIKNDEVHICTRLTRPAPPFHSSQNYVFMKKWQIDRNSIKIQELIGQGQFGKVYKGSFQDVPVAVKTMNEFMDKDDCQLFLEEANLLTKLDHQHLIRLLAVCTKEKPYYIITEFMANKSLLNFLKLGLDQNKLTTESAMNIAAQVASGMSYLSANKVIHRDLAARNVLVGDISPNHIPIVKVADFGLARQLKYGNEEYDMQRDTQMPIRWLAPEGFLTKTFNTKTDVWAYGILLWEIGTLGETPYSQWSNQYAIEQVCSGYKLPKPETVPDFVYNDAFLPCIDMNPLKRPNFEQLFKYFDDDIRISKVKRSRISSYLHV